MVVNISPLTSTATSIMRSRMSQTYFSVSDNSLHIYFIVNIFGHKDRKRYVVYARKDFDASQVPAEWHAWLHYITDEAPTSGGYVHRFFQTPHQPNMTGTNKRYVPYSTTDHKIISFKPSSQPVEGGFRRLTSSKGSGL